MAGWQVFGTLAAGNQPLSLFDTLTGQIAQCVIVPCTATGTNAIVLSINSNGPLVPSYNNYQKFSFIAANNSTGSVTIQVGVLAALNLYKPGNIAAGSGDITAGVYYEVAFNQALNAGGGGFVVASATPATLSLPVTVANGGTGLTSLTTFAPLVGGTGITSNVQQATTGFSTVGAVLTSQGNAAVPTWVTPSGGTGTLVSIQTFSTSQTITIPATATKCWVRLVGGGGGPVTGTNGGGAGGYLEKYLTGLTAGNTLALTIGAGGASNGHNGGASSLASGSQTITTLTANGGSGVNNGSNNPGGTATNGDVNIQGGAGTPTPTGGDNPLSSTAAGDQSGLGIGGGGSSNIAAEAGAGGACIFFWYT